MKVNSITLPGLLSQTALGTDTNGKIVAASQLAATKTALAFSNSWRAYGASTGQETPGWTRQGGIVFLTGLLDTSNAHSFTVETMFTLPVGARPANNVIMPVSLQGSNANVPQLGRIDVASTGVVTLQYGGPGGGTVTWVSLAGCCFFAA